MAINISLRLHNCYYLRILMTSSNPQIMLKTTAILSLLLLASQVQSADDPWTLNLHFENDLFANTDLDYTNGVRASWVSPDLHDFIADQQQTYDWVNRVNELLQPLHPQLSAQGRVHRNIVVSVGQLMFTPRDNSKTELDVSDRPYAGWLYAGFGYQARTAQKLHSFEFNIGVVGPAALAQQTQNAVHDIRALERFQGWDNQLHNELGVQLVFERKRRFRPLPGKYIFALETDLISHWGGSLGNVATYLNGGAELRLGWALPKDFGRSSIRPGGDSNNPGLGNPRHRNWQVHAYLAGDGRAVAHNIFLDGNSFRDSHSVSKKPFVADLAVGVSATYQRWNISYSQVYRTKEFSTQQQSQQYGSLSVSYSY